MRRPSWRSATEGIGPKRVRRQPVACASTLAGALLLCAAATAAPDPGLPSAPQMQFVPPAAGTYSLQRIQSCPDAVLLDASGHRRRLSDLTRGKITLLTFFYTYCTDPLGCPYAFGLMSALRDRIVADPGLAPNVRFVSISFDPSHDSPEQLRNYARGLSAAAPFEWDFLTASSMARLAPMLDDLGQDVRIELDSAGRPARAINHMLKLFLIDAAGTVREIYALDYLQPEVMLNDIRTLRLEAQRGERTREAGAGTARWIRTP
jgi:protein SCO1/2